ncbi:methyl-accepting chemotaxis protein [Duganella sp. BuS-21]|uniref:methyl-accepting chemotaxis protein n=1 Tax=Duganella sp. BuS-21 TaxID=2943848 RepID=UPI0035A61D06
MKLNNLGIGQQLSLAFGFVLCMMVVLNVTGGYLVEKNKLALRNNIESLNLQKDAVRELKSALLDQALHAMGQDDAGLRRLQEARQQIQRVSYPTSESAMIRDLLAPGGRGAGTGLADVAIVAGIDRLERQLASRSRDQLDAASAADDRVSRLLFMISAIALALIVAVAWRIIRGIVQPLRGAMRLADRVAQGDLTGDIRSSGRNEASVLVAGLKRMNDNLVGIVGEVRAGTHNMSMTAQEMARGNSDLSARTETQAAALEEAATSIEELVSSVLSNADNAGRATGLALSACAVASAGGDAMLQVEQTMASISESSRKVVEIIAVIDSIAFQTNLLALNASVEAARAGAEGRGFAVVAAEVRALAMRSADAAKRINLLISDTVGRVEHGTVLVDKAGRTISDALTSVQSVTDLITHIATSSREQSAGIESISQTMATLDEITQQNAALVEEAAAAAQGLWGQAESLSRAVSVFVLPVPAARADVLALA